MITAFGDELDEDVLRGYLRKEGSEDAFDLLQRIAAAGTPVTEQALDALWHQHYR